MPVVWGLTRTRARFCAFAIFLSFFAWCLSAAQATADKKQEQALRTRVEEFYSLLQAGRGSAIEAYVTPNTRENFRSYPKEPFLGYTVESVKIEPDGKTATVGARLEVLTGMPPLPFKMLRTTNWRLIDGDWYLEVPKRQQIEGQQLGAFARNAGLASPKPTPPDAEQLKFKGHRYFWTWIPRGEKRTARFPFTNTANHPIRLDAVLTGCTCLQVKTEKKEFAPGESGELVIEFDPGGREREFIQTIVVKAQPGNQLTYLTIEAFLEPTPNPDEVKQQKASQKAQKLPEKH